MRQKRKNKINKKTIIILAVLAIICAVLIFIISFRLNRKEDMADKQVTELELQNVDTGELEDLLEDVKMINMDAYTDESVQNLQKAVENAVNGEAENKELGNLYMEVVYAIRNLEKKS